MYMFMLSGYRNAMNMAQAIELGIHCSGHFFICPALQGVCVCGSLAWVSFTSSSLVMTWCGSQSFVRLPSSSPSAYTLLLMSYMYYGNTATSPSESQVKM